MAGELSLELQKPSSKYVYELQETKFPAALRRAIVRCGLQHTSCATPRYGDGKLRCGEAAFTWLYVDVAWLDATALADLLRLARQGLPICLAQQPRQPGRVKAAAYDQQVMKLAALPNVTAGSPARRRWNPPLAEGDDLARICGVR